MRQFFFAALLLWTCMGYARTYSGRVIDAHTKEPIPGASVYAPAHQKGTATNSSGVFELYIQGGTDSLRFSMIGYKVLSHKAADQMLVELVPSVTELNQVVVTAGRDEQPRTEAPVAISTISKQLLNETKPASLDQVLNKVSGVYMVDLGNEQHSMAIRQPMSYKSLFLYLEDGIPIRATGDFNHNALIEINMAALRSIEIIRGPSSSLYGSEAVGGAVNFITQAPTLLPTAKIQAEVSNHGCRRSDFSVSNTIGRFGFTAAGYYVDQKHGYREQNDYSKLALTLRGDYIFSNRIKLVTTGTLVDYETDQAGALDSLRFYTMNYKSIYSFNYRKVNALRIRSTLDHSWNGNNNTMVTAFFRNNSIGQNPFYSIKSTGNPLKARGEINEDNFKSYGVIAQHKKKFAFWDTRLVSGASIDQSPASYIANFISIDRDIEGNYTSYTETDSLLAKYDVKLLNTAAYMQTETSPLKKMKIIAAIRYDRMSYAFDNHLQPSAFTGAPDENDFFHHLTPKAGITYDLDKERGVYGNYSVGFAPPQITELYRGVKVPLLQPATYNNYEVGGWFSFAKEKGYADISVYLMNGKNEIISARLPDGSYENQNAGTTSHRGIEYTINYSPVKELAVRVSGTNAVHSFVEYVEKGKNYSGNQMNGAPAFIGNTEITYKPSFIKGFRIAGELQHIGKYYMDAENTEKYSGFDLVNLRAGYRCKSFETWVNVLNVTNTVYATVAEKSAWGKSYRPGNLRTFHFGLAYNFIGKPRQQHTK